MYTDLLKKAYQKGSWDCVALTQEVFSRHGITIPVSAALRCAVDSIDSDQGRSNLMITVISKTWREVYTPVVPCLVVIFRAGFASHYGVYIGQGNFIHISETRKYATIESINSNLYANRKFYIFNGHSQSV